MTASGEHTYCETTFNYVTATGFATVHTPVTDARAASPGTFDECGFTRLDMPSAVTDWRDQTQVDLVHGAEVADLAMSFTGCSDVVVYPTLIRSPRAATQDADYAPIEVVHSDFTDDYGRMIVEPDRAYRSFLDPMLEAQGMTPQDLADAERVMMLQLWRNTGPAHADRPLAFCDARSVPEARLNRHVVPTYGGSRLDFETFLAGPPPSGRTDDWYTYPALHDDEAVALRTFDSARVRTGDPYWTLHSAFVDPHVEPTAAHRRESVEMRALCIWR